MFGKDFDGILDMIPTRSSGLGSDARFTRRHSVLRDLPPPDIGGGKIITTTYLTLRHVPCCGRCTSDVYSLQGLEDGLVDNDVNTSGDPMGSTRLGGALVDADEEPTDRSFFWLVSDYFKVVGLVFKGMGMVVGSVLPKLPRPRPGPTWTDRISVVMLPCVLTNPDRWRVCTDRPLCKRRIPAFTACFMTAVR